MRRPAGLRFGTRRSGRGDRYAPMPLEAAKTALAASAAMSLGAADLDTLLRLWSRRGGASRDYSDGSVELLLPNGERLTRGTRDHIADQLRLRLARLDLWGLVTT